MTYNHRTLNLSNKDLSAFNSNDSTNDNLNSNNFSSNLQNNNSNAANHLNNNNVPNNSSLNNTNDIKSLNGTNGNNNNNSILKQEHLLNCLAELFHQIVTMKKKKGIMHPKKFIARLRKDNGN